MENRGNKMRFFLTLFICLFAASPLLGQKTEDQVRSTVQLKMIQAQRLNEQGNEIKAKQLVDESIAIMLEAIRNNQSQPWMREGLKIAMQATRTPEEEVERVMKEVDLLIDINRTINVIKGVTENEQVARPLSLREQLNSLTDSPAVKELARDRRRAALGGMFLGQKNGAVGYRPIISFFPQGDMMTVGAIVSPDRRYVRIGVSAANTGIGAVHTFNFSTGEYQSLDNKK